MRPSSSLSVSFVKRLQDIQRGRLYIKVSAQLLACVASGVTLSGNHLPTYLHLKSTRHSNTATKARQIISRPVVFHAEPSAILLSKIVTFGLSNPFFPQSVAFILFTQPCWAG
jgi:hypothetical protein